MKEQFITTLKSFSPK